jgi:hypothetical protein
MELYKKLLLIEGAKVYLKNSKIILVQLHLLKSFKILYIELNDSLGPHFDLL